MTDATATTDIAQDVGAFLTADPSIPTPAEQAAAFRRDAKDAGMSDFMADTLAGIVEADATKSGQNELGAARLALLLTIAKLGTA